MKVRKRLAACRTVACAMHERLRLATSSCRIAAEAGYQDPEEGLRHGTQPAPPVEFSH
jgi:hypothetical protein